MRSADSTPAPVSGCGQLSGFGLRDADIPVELLESLEAVLTEDGCSDPEARALATLLASTIIYPVVEDYLFDP